VFIRLKLVEAACYSGGITASRFNLIDIGIGNGKIANAEKTKSGILSISSVICRNWTSLKSVTRFIWRRLYITDVRWLCVRVMVKSASDIFCWGNWHTLL